MYYKEMSREQLVEAFDKLVETLIKADRLEEWETFFEENFNVWLMPF